MNQKGRPLRESDGSILFNAPRSDRDATVDAFSGINWSLITIPGDAVQLMAKEEYNDGCKVLLQIKDSSILSQLRNKANPNIIIRICINDEWIIAQPREILDPPRGPFFAVDSSEQVIISDKGQMEIVILSPKDK